MSALPMHARALRWLLPALALLLALLGSPPLQAHEMSMAELHVQEVAPGRFVWQWTAGMRSGNDELQLQWPEGCTAGPGQLDCPGGRMRGRLGIGGVGEGYSAVLVKLHWLDGGLRVYTLTKAQRSVQLFGSANDPRGLAEIAHAYTMLGIEHILSGVDHLLFVVTLLLLVGFERRLVWTITAFTAAHSLTLASSALGWLTLRPPPVEATIALSIVLVAAEACPRVASRLPPGGALSSLGRPGGTEALHHRDTLTRRWPALVAFIFGLVHGLGFAGALKEIGLPEQHLPAALLSFNVGVEIGQLITVALAYAVSRLLPHLAALWPRAARARGVLLYAIGSLAAYWSWSRVAAILA
ncbi:HupE/UreJ family protein [Aquabacterium sp. OR-4]|uniref:HupE/UreJ family protein n=1 Tax=Aquabacterium sp. OR-4 TaxID=2978127 RepID=UPI0028C7A882|nr:HupE/UreJ family protein [Aquabacterium sp. OR-4]MDT7838920.1 HupE/UreJ family protein [Aquabacterium sp. OR-4]